MQQIRGSRGLSCKGFSRVQLQVFNRRTVSERNTKPKTRIGIEDLAPKLPKQEPPPPQRPSRPKLKQKTSFIQRTPILNRFADGVLLFGDVIMILATEGSSERIPWDSQWPLLAGIQVGAWVLAAAIMGDYRGQYRDQSDTPFFVDPTFWAILDACVTWGLSAIFAMAAFSAAVSTHILDPAPLFTDIGTEDLSPQLEVAIAGIVVMTCWRGIALRLRI